LNSAPEILSPDEIRDLVQKSTVRGLTAVAFTWSVILGVLWVAGTWPSVLTVGLALVILGGRQVALAVLMHESAHGTLVVSRRWNDWVGQWLCGRPVWLDLLRYRSHHLKHHRYTGSDQDPDLPLITPFPTTPWGLARKLGRDLLGISGARRLVALVLMDLGYLAYALSGEAEWLDPSDRTPAARAREAAREIGPVILTNCVLAATLAALGVGWTWWLWAAAWATTNGAFLRLFFFNDTATTEIYTERFRNTRTTLVGSLARATVAPHNVAFHLEHHLLMTVPFHQLPRLHAILMSRGALQNAPVAKNYWEVLRAISSAPSSAERA
jgi:fatty acid desaturase